MRDHVSQMAVMSHRPSSVVDEMLRNFNYSPGKRFTLSKSYNIKGKLYIECHDCYNVFDLTGNSFKSIQALKDDLRNKELASDIPEEVDGVLNDWVTRNCWTYFWRISEKKRTDAEEEI